MIFSLSLIKGLGGLMANALFYEVGGSNPMNTLSLPCPRRLGSGLLLDGDIVK